MQKKLKIATFIAAVFATFVFTTEYFYTTVKTIMSYPGYSQARLRSLEENLIISDDENALLQQQEDGSNFFHPTDIEAFDYKAPIAEIDKKSLKKTTPKKPNYNSYEDRIRTEKAENLDANGLYVALMQAVADNDINRAKTMITRGARLNSPDGNTSYAPIFWAIANGNVDMVKLLLQKGAKLNTPDDNGKFPIHWAVENSSSRANVYQTKAIFDLLLASNPREINRQDNVSQRTPLMMSVILDNKKAFAYLLDNGANISIKDKEKKDIRDISLSRACHACIYLIEQKEKENESTPIPNFASTFTAPDSVWLPYTPVKKPAPKTTQLKRDPNSIVIQGNGNAINLPVYKEMPQILPLKEESDEPDLIIGS